MVVSGDGWLVVVSGGGGGGGYGQWCWGGSGSGEGDMPRKMLHHCMCTFPVVKYYFLQGIPQII